MSREQIGKFMVAKEMETGVRYWAIHSVRGDAYLGCVKWYASWSKYVFYPDGDALFSDDCLTAMVEFLARKTKDRPLITAATRCERWTLVPGPIFSKLAPPA